MTDIKVLIVDDSAVVRQVLSAVLNQASGIQVIDVAVDPVYAMEKMSKQWPDVIVLDVEMPRMDGITFLKKTDGAKAYAGGDLFDADREGRQDHVAGIGGRCSQYRH
ncbi:hypothetical protein GCM10009086_19710 [Pseudomonas rhodesiae]